MFKRMFPLLVAVMIVVSAAPVAMADHCARCKFTVDTQFCIFNALFGREFCDDSSGVCIVSGATCTHTAALTPLSTEFAVASVERIDEAPAPNQALVAKLEAPKPVAESTR